MRFTNAENMCRDKYQKKLYDTKTTPSRDKLLLSLLGVKSDQLNDIYEKRHVHNPNTNDINLSGGVAEITHFYRQKINNEIGGDFAIEISTDSIQMLCKEFGVSYQPDIIFDETVFHTDWSEVHDQELIKKLSGGDDILPSQKHYLLKNGDKLWGHTRDLLNWERKQGYISLVFLLPFSPEETANDNWNTTWTMLNGTMSTGCKQIDKYALIVAIQLLNLGDNRDKTYFDIIDNSFMTKDFKKLLTLDYVVLADRLDITPLEGMGDKPHSDIGRILQTKLNFVPATFRKKKVLPGNNDNKRDDLEHSYQSLTRLMSHTSGLVCKLNIPATDEFRKTNKSNTWLFGPEYWIHFLSKQTINQKAKDKKGREMSQESVSLVDEDGKPKPAIYHYVPPCEYWPLRTTGLDPVSFPRLKGLKID